MKRNIFVRNGSNTSKTPDKETELIETLNDNVNKTETPTVNPDTTTVSVDLAAENTHDTTVKTTYCRDSKGRFCSAHTETVDAPAEIPAVRSCVPTEEETDTPKKYDCDINAHAPHDASADYFRGHVHQIKSRETVENKEINKRFFDNNRKVVSAIDELKTNPLKHFTITDNTPITPSAKLDKVVENIKDYEFVNHPNHYAGHSSIETIEKIRRIYGDEMTAMWCEITAFKYRDRIGYKPNNSDAQEVAKIRWYENKAKELRKK